MSITPRSTDAQIISITPALRKALDELSREQVEQARHTRQHQEIPPSHLEQLLLEDRRLVAARRASRAPHMSIQGTGYASEEIASYGTYVMNMAAGEDSIIINL